MRKRLRLLIRLLRKIVKKEKPINLIILGPPGAGKGSQALKLAKRYAIPSISASDLLREEIERATNRGKMIKRKMQSGQLVPDKIMIKLIEKRITEKDCKDGFVLDGFPRTVKQASALKKMFKKNSIELTRAVLITVKDRIAVARLRHRQTCQICGATYNKVNRPKEEGQCDECRGKLIQREDDTINVIKKRLRKYKKHTKPVIDYYKKRDQLSRVSSDLRKGKLGIGETHKKIHGEIKKIRKKSRHSK